VAEGFFMAEFDQGKRTADQVAGVARDTIRKSEAVTQQSVKAAQESFATASEGFRDLNVKMIEIAHENTEAFFDFARKVATTKEPAALMQLFSEHTKKQMEMFSKQSHDLTALGKQLSGKAMAPASQGLR
jgi:hypothetical protein